ncbi:MAG: vWA domain-containing protein [Flavobacteriales bacterium]
MKKILSPLAATSLVAALALLLLNLNSGRETVQPQHTDFSLPPELPMILVQDSTFCGPVQQRGYITFKAGVDNIYYRTDTTARECYLYAEVSAGNYIPAQMQQRAPLNLSIVIDRSGSMSGEKLANAKRAAKYAVDQLNAQDFISIVVYDDEVAVQLASCPATDKAAMHKAIDSITDKGSTNLCGGMMEGYSQCKKTFCNGCVNKVLLLSDGLANVGIINQDEITRIVSNNEQQQGILISTFGLGADYNENLMTAIAESGNGNYYFIEKSEDIAMLFQKELEGMLRVVAQNTRIELQVPQGLTLSKAYGCNYVLDGDKATISLRDIYANERKGILLKFKIDDNFNSNIAFNVQLHYDDAVSKTSGQQLAHSLGVIPVLNNTIASTGVMRCIKQQIATYISNEQLEQAMREMDLGNYENGRAMLQSNTVYISSMADQYGADEELMRMDSLNRGYFEESKNIEAMEMEEKKIMQKSSKENNYKARTKK